MALLLTFAAMGFAASKQTALDRYVSRARSPLQYELVNTIQGEGYKAFIIDLASQPGSASRAGPHGEEHWLTIVQAPDSEIDSRDLLHHWRIESR